jgi:hypothetical protein
MKRMIKLVALLEGRGMKTMKSFLIAMVVLGIATLATINVVLNKNAPIASNLTLQNLEASTQESGESGGSTTWGCGGNVTYVPHKTLKSRVCIAFWRTHLSCKKQDNVCCDPAKQTDCDGDLPDISL